jgi:starch-binding outer membrane protein, SusD/RagB family
MKKYINIILLISSLSLFSCEKFLEPGRYNDLYEANIYGDATYTEGLLMTAYNGLPNDYYFYSDVATDDAVTNVKDSQYKRMATGEWSSQFYPGSPWSSAYSAIFYINKFLSVYESVKYSVDVRNSDAVNAKRDLLHKQRLKGEAYGLRAWYKWQLLQNYSGKTSDGRLLGFPIVDEMISTSDNWKLPRNTFAECVNSIMSDLDIAIASLPKIYADSTGKADWNATMGARFENRIPGNAAVILKSRVALLAASPAFAESNVVTWAKAAQIAGPTLKDLGALFATGKTFYTDIRNKEIIWNRSQLSKRTWETNNFAPSLFGSGNTNPSQNLVDAFPSKNGYPINHPSNSTYSPANPYSNRDTRLGDYVIYNTLNFKSVIYTYIGAPLNGINVLSTSTRTGYYLKKFMASGVSLTSGSQVSTAHTYTLARMTELLLNYCEAANEAWGPDGDPNGYGFTARSKIRDLRIRAGITQPDAYLNSITDAAGLRALIRNERRIELCFEGFRFWDIRRWNDITTMQTGVKGAYITLNGTVYSYSYDPVESRLYAPYMIYPPIPYNETLKYSIDQNNGW